MGAQGTGREDRTGTNRAFREFIGAEGGLAPLLKAAAPSVPGLNLLPGVRKTARRSVPSFGLQRSDVVIEPGHVAAYGALCGFPRKDTLPLPYPHLLAFPLHLALMSDPAFGFPAMGSVHLENSITQRRPIGLEERLDVQVHVREPRAHTKGTVLDFVSEVRSDGDLVWGELSSYLVRGRGDDTAPGGMELGAPVPGTTTWRLAGDLGRRYGRVSGDVNPIHLTALSAKALSFNRQIAHGMWSMARCVGALENRLPDAVRVEVGFKKPIFLPGTVAFGVQPTASGQRGGGQTSAGQPSAGQPNLSFALTRPKDGAPHLVGRTVAL